MARKLTVRVKSEGSGHAPASGERRVRASSPVLWKDAEHIRIRLKYIQKSLIEEWPDTWGKQ